MTVSEIHNYERSIFGCSLKSVYGTKHVYCCITQVLKFFYEEHRNMNK